MPAEKRDSVLYIKARTELLAFRGDFKRIVDLLEGKVEHSTLPNGDPALGIMWFAYNHCRLLTGQLDSYDAIRCDWNSFNERRGPFDDSVVAEIEASLGYAAFLELRFTAAYDHLANTVRLSTGNEHEKMFKYRCGLEWIRHECGGSHVARQNLEDLLKESEYRAAHALAPMGLAYLAWIATCTGEYNVARLELDRLSSLTLTSKLFPNTFMMYIDLCSGISRFYCGDIADGLQRIERAADRIKGLARLEFLLATNIYRYFGELAGINCKYSGPAGHSKDKRDSFEMLYVCTLQAYRLMKSEEYEKAIRFARRIWTGAEKGGALPWIVTGCFFESYAQFKTDNLKESKELLRRGIGVLDEIQWKNYPLANSEVTSFVVTRAVAWGIKSEILEKLSYAGNVRDVRDCLIEELTGEEVSSESKIDLVRFAIGHRVPGLVDTMRSLSAGDNRILTAISEQYLETHKEMDLPQLRVSALGSSSAIIDSRKVKFHRVKSKHLFFWLLLEYPNSLHEETIMEYLWPDSPPAKSRQNLQTTVSALRRSLDPDSMLCPRSYVLYDANQYSIDIPAASHVDIHTFEKSYHHIIEGLVDAPNLTEFQEREIRHTLDLCQGSLLPEMRFESFVETRREESSRKYFDLLEAYLGKMFQQEKYQAAESYLERGLQIEPLWANGVRLAMEMYSRSSRTLYALKAYRKYEAQLKSEVGVEPDEGLQQLLEKLRVS